MSNRTLTVARKDFEDAAKSRMLWSLMGLLVLIVGLIYFAIWWTTSSPEPLDIVGPASAILQLLVPLVALIAGYMAIVGERQSGSIKVLLSLPPNRSDVVFGKFLGRAGVILSAVAAALVTLILLSIIMFQSLPLGDFLGIAGASAITGVAFVGLAVGISASVASRGKAMAIVIGLYLIFLLFWDLITAGVYRLLEGELPPGPGANEWEAWYIFLQWLNPIEAYAILTDAVLGETFGAFTIPLFAPQDLSDTEQIVAGDVPFYLETWMAAVVLLAWMAIPVLLGYIRFERADLG